MPLTLPQLERHLFKAADLLTGRVRNFAETWPDAEIVQQAVGPLPWHRQLLTSRAHAALLLDV